MRQSRGPSSVRRGGAAGLSTLKNFLRRGSQLLKANQVKEPFPNRNAMALSCLSFRVSHKSSSSYRVTVGILRQKEPSTIWRFRFVGSGCQCEPLHEMARYTTSLIVGRGAKMLWSMLLHVTERYRKNCPAVSNTPLRHTIQL